MSAKSNRWQLLTPAGRRFFEAMIPWRMDHKRLTLLFLTLFALTLIFSPWEKTAFNYGGHLLSAKNSIAPIFWPPRTEDLEKTQLRASVLFFEWLGLAVLYAGLIYVGSRQDQRNGRTDADRIRFNSKAGRSKTCPFCREQIREEAIKCRFCGEWLNPPPESNQDSSKKPDSVPLVSSSTETNQSPAPKSHKLSAEQSVALFAVNQIVPLVVIAFWILWYALPHAIKEVGVQGLPDDIRIDAIISSTFSYCTTPLSLLIIVPLGIWMIGSFLFGTLPRNVANK